MKKKEKWRAWAAGITDKHLIAEFEMAICDRHENDFHGRPTPKDLQHAFAAIRNELFGRLQGRAGDEHRQVFRAAEARG